MTHSEFRPRVKVVRHGAIGPMPNTERISHYAQQHGPNLTARQHRRLWKHAMREQFAPNIAARKFARKVAQARKAT